MSEEGALASDDDDIPVLKRIEADLQNTELSFPETKHVDLFSEIHLNELKKLEKQLEQVNYLLLCNYDDDVISAHRASAGYKHFSRL